MGEYAADGRSGLSRRAFLVGAAGVAAVTVFPVVPATRAWAQASAPALRRQTFLPLLNQSFRLVADDGRRATVVLAAISDLRPEPAPGSDRRFRLLFDGQTAEALPQGTYGLESARVGTVNVLTVPLGPPSALVRYEVIINNPG